MNLRLAAVWQASASDLGQRSPFPDLHTRTCPEVWPRYPLEPRHPSQAVFQPTHGCPIGQPPECVQGLVEAETSNNRKMAAQHGAVDAILNAIAEDNMEEVTQLLDQDSGLLEARADQESEYESGGTPLIVAAAYGHVSVVRLLLERGAGIEARDDLGATAIVAAAENGHEEIVALLLSHGADGGVMNDRGATPLHFASRDGRLGMVRLLLQHLKGRGIDDASPAQATPLWSACRRGHREVARALLMAGADPTIASSFIFGAPTTPIREAEGNGNHDIVNLLEWWEGELERGYVVHRARYHLDKYSLWQPQFAALEALASTMPHGFAHLRLRLSPPEVEIVLSAAAEDEEQEEDLGQGSSKRKGTGQGRHRPCEGEKDATLKYVMQDLAPELYIELMTAFHK